MSSQAEKKENRDSLFVEVLEYDNLEIILSKIVVPFSKFEKASSAPDLYSGSERIPFEARDPLYKSAMSQEFAGAMRAIRKKTK
ncbi:hypothetical protein ES705_12620 [subsurface metagenome]